MATTYEAIATVEVGSGGAADIEFTSIPATFTDLVVKMSGRSTSGGVNRGSYIAFNGSSTGYTDLYLQGSGSAASSGSAGGTGNIYLGETDGSGATASTFSNQEIYIPNYTSANYKSVSADSVAETNATTQYMSLNAGLWSNAAAITSILLTTSGNFAEHSTATLYGIKNS
jgi:hypothetical protein